MNTFVNLIVGIFFLGIGISLIVRTDYWIARFEAQDARSRAQQWIRGTAYGRWFSGVEPTFLRVMGIVSIVAAVAAVAFPA